jgi:hypothetical protein
MHLQLIPHKYLSNIFNSLKLFTTDGTSGTARLTNIHSYAREGNR